jgi:fluoroquinolone transport system ATP-binding protein
VAFLVEGRIAAIDAPRALRLAYGRRVVRVEALSNGARVTRDFVLDTLADDGAFGALLRSGNIETIHTLETTLEDVFVRMTGRTLA